MRCAQNSRSQFPQRYCLICTNLNNLSSKSRRRERLITSLLQSGHVITRRFLYSLIGRSKYPISAYVRRSGSSNASRDSIFRQRPLRRQNLRPHFVQLYGLIQRNLNSLSNRLRRRDRAIIALLQLGHRSRDNATGKWFHNLNSTSIFDLPRSFHLQILSLLHISRCFRVVPNIEALMKTTALNENGNGIWWQKKVARHNWPVLE